MDPLTPAHSNSQKQHLALRVALDTMKDRCILQQKRLTEVEEENQLLREQLTSQNKGHNVGHNAGGVAENFQLRLQVSELQRQNSQLNAHISMVSAENRKLWSRLSQIAKDQTPKGKDPEATLTPNGADACGDDSSPRGALTASQNLIRSKTFTQHSPNPNLRHKLVATDGMEAEMRTNSSEDEGEAQLDDAAQIAVGFGYLNVDDGSSPGSSPDQDFNAEAKKCIEGLQAMQQEALKQQEDLNAVFHLLQSRIALQPCPDCVKKSQKPEMADKSLETDESLNDPSSAQVKANWPNGKLPVAEEATRPILPANHLELLGERLLADDSNKVCPMCGKIYDGGVTFEWFCEHVEEHFRDGSIELDHGVEHNFELISHTVGDF